jgi:hypothetical protein
VELVEIGTSELGAAHESNDAARGLIFDDWEYEKVVLGEELHAAVEGVGGVERLNVGSHEVGCEEAGARARGSDGEMNLVENNDAQQAILGIDDGEHGVGFAFEAIDDGRE